ncbi:F-box At1g67623 [Olea europaea subsp. europaea]|uniref:F-box At1g67623 n=1 Tax=Olea europaea subsp. europaea TaxID=158383 RepID=A0A8S0SR77_OLEEU|nr:F-box At1g67623 [Olea europaea subsp. europaea]
MTRRCTHKNMRKNAKRIVSTIGTIPTDLASDIMARVAANSLTDIANIKLSCKVLKEIAEDPYVYQNASLKKFPIGHWWLPSKEEKTFLNKCWEYGNPELLYRRGVLGYFGRNQLVSALKYLKKAVKLGHIGALHVICIILLLSDGECKRSGIAILSKMKKSRELRRKLKDYRNNLTHMLCTTIWVNRSLHINHLPICCTQTHPAKKHAWPPMTIEEEDVSCDACIGDAELAFIFDGLPGIK